MGQPAVGDGDCAIWLPIDMRQNNAIGIDEPVSARDCFHCPGLGKWREGLAAKTSEVAIRPYRSGHVPATAARKPEQLLDDLAPYFAVGEFFCVNVQVPFPGPQVCRLVGRQLSASFLDITRNINNGSCALARRSRSMEMGGSRLAT